MPDPIRRGSRVGCTQASDTLSLPLAFPGGKVVGIVQRVGPIVEQAIAAVLNRADHSDTVSITAALNKARAAAPDLVASDDELSDAIVEAATAMGCS